MQNYAPKQIFFGGETIFSPSSVAISLDPEREISEEIPTKTPESRNPSKEF